MPAPALPAPVRRAEAGFACHIPASRAAPRRAACEVVLLPWQAAGRGRGTRWVGLVLAGAGAGGGQAEGANGLRIHTGEARVPHGTVCHVASLHGTPRWAERLQRAVCSAIQSSSIAMCQPDAGRTERLGVHVRAAGRRGDQSTQGPQDGQHLRASAGWPQLRLLACAYTDAHAGWVGTVARVACCPTRTRHAGPHHARRAPGLFMYRPSAGCCVPPKGSECGATSVYRTCCRPRNNRCARPHTAECRQM